MNRLADVTSALSLGRRGSEQGRDEVTHYSLRSVDSMLHRYFKVFQINLDRMKQHKLNVQKFLADNSVSELTKEYVYTLQSVLQLTVIVEQIKQIRSQIEVEDLPVLDRRLANLLNGAILLLAEFLLLDSEVAEHNSSSISSGKLRRAHSASDDDVGHQRLASRVSVTCRQQSIELQYYGSEIDCIRAWNQLKLKLLDFNDSMQKLFLLVETHSSTDAGLVCDQTVAPTNNTSCKLSKLKCLVVPVADAVFGGSFGGPISFVAGLKAAKMAAFRGGLFGMASGMVHQKRENGSTSSEQDVEQRAVNGTVVDEDVVDD